MRTPHRTGARLAVVLACLMVGCEKLAAAPAGLAAGAVAVMPPAAVVFAVLTIPAALMLVYLGGRRTAVPLRVSPAVRSTPRPATPLFRASNH